MRRTATPGTARREFVMPPGPVTPAFRVEELERRDTPAFAQLGAFTAGITAPSVIAVADFNRDGRADVAVGNAPPGVGLPGTVGIALGNGDGTFTAGPVLTGTSLTLPQSIVAADVNRDGVPDLAVASYDPNQSGGPGSTLVFLGRGDGTFGGPTFTQPVASIAVAVADFTGDGIADLLSVGAVGNSFRVFPGKGDGTFSPAAPQQAPLAVNRVAVADFDGDGFLDFAGVGTGPAGTAIVTLYGRGNGTFAPAVFTTPGGEVLDLAAGDFDGDGRTDVVAANVLQAVFYKNLGGRAFDAAGVPVLTAGRVIARLAAADLNGDGRPDVVAVGGPEVDAATSLGGGAFAPDPGNPYLTPGKFAGADVALGDVDADGNTDAVVVRSGSTGVGGEGRVFLNLAPDRTTTTLTTAPNPSAAGQPITLTAVVAPVVPPFPAGATPTGTVTFLADGQVLGTAALVNGTATLSVPPLAPGSHQIVASYAGDAAFRPSASPPVAQVVIAAAVPPPNPVIRFDVTGLPPGPGLGADRVASGSITPDGVPDVVIGSGGGRPARVTVIDGQTRQVLAEVLPFGAAFTGGAFVAVGDVDGDGAADLAVAADAGGGPRVRVFLTRGAELVPAVDFFALDPDYRGGLRVALGDLNHDGCADLVVTGGPGSGPRVATYDGGSLLPGLTPDRLGHDFFALDPDFRGGLFVAVGDLDGDGYGEIVVGADAGGGPRVAVWAGASLAGDEPEQVAGFFAGPDTDRGGVRVAVRDADGDGRADLLTGAGVGSGSRVRLYAGAEIIAQPAPVPFYETDAFPDLTGGVYVA